MITLYCPRCNKSIGEVDGVCDDGVILRKLCDECGKTIDFKIRYKAKGEVLVEKNLTE